MLGRRVWAAAGGGSPALRVAGLPGATPLQDGATAMQRRHSGLSEAKLGRDEAGQASRVCVLSLSSAGREEIVARPLPGRAVSSTRSCFGSPAAPQWAVSARGAASAASPRRTRPARHKPLRPRATPGPRRGVYPRAHESGSRAGLQTPGRATRHAKRHLQSVWAHDHVGSHGSPM